MPERLQIRTRVAERAPDDERGARSRPRTRAVVEALKVARSVLPSRDPARNGPEKLALYLALGVPLTLALLGAFVATATGNTWAACADALWAFDAGLLALVTLGPIAFTWLISFAIALAFPFLTRGSGSRVRQALVCPYCRDEVDQDQTVCCVRKGCGALYHRECWDECSVQYGGCAIYGCSSKKSREVSAAGYVLQIGRLLVATALFPPRVARAMREHGGEELSGVLPRSWELALRWRRATTRYLVVRVGLYLLGYPLGNALMARTLAAFPESWLGTDSFFVTLSVVLGTIAPFVACVVGMLLLPFVVTLLLAPFVYTARAFATIFLNELAGLVRADEGGGTVVGRLELGLGSKKGL